METSNEVMPDPVLLTIENYEGTPNFEVTTSVLQEWLHGGVCHVQFTKVKDGTVRDMTCTLNEALIPDEHMPKGEVQVSNSDLTARVWDLEVEGWRSFRYDSVIRAVDNYQERSAVKW